MFYMNLKNKEIENKRIDASFKAEKYINNNYFYIY